MKTATMKDPNRIFRKEGQSIDEALKRGVREALLRHKERGNPVVIERDGKIVWLSAQELLDR
jgi:isoaspartyl peptidase/L-asparaginase-like protein (Ntn-hydrolase superfamily)